MKVSKGEDEVEQLPVEKCLQNDASAERRCNEGNAGTLPLQVVGRNTARERVR